MAEPTLEVIINKIRRITRSLSPGVLPDDTIKEYINTFVQYDFPAHLKLFNLHKEFSFYTEPYQSKYTSDAMSPVLSNFKNDVLSIDSPVFIAGKHALFTTSKSTFFGLHPKISSIETTSNSGDGAIVTFSGVIGNGSGISILAKEVLLSSVDANKNGLKMVDFPISNSVGNLYVPGESPTSETVKDVANYIDYTTGAYTVTFTLPPASGEAIISHTVRKQPSEPTSMLFYDGEITLAPIPDKVYKVSFNAFLKPSELIASSDTPELDEWWQYIAYGAAKKVFEDRMDLESVQQIMPEFKRQETLITRRTIQQQSEQQVATIYNTHPLSGDVDRFNNFN